MEKEAISTGINIMDTYQPNPLLLLAIIVLGGAAGGWLARKCRLPGITGNILGGFILGQTLLTKGDPVATLQPLSVFAMGLISASVGSHLSYRRLHNALRRIITIALLESILCALAVWAGLYLFKDDLLSSLLLAALAVASSPATVMALVREHHARGTYVKTLLSAVAVDNILCIMIFAFIQTVGQDHFTPGVGIDIRKALLETGRQVAGAIIIGGALGVMIERIMRISRFHNFSTTFLAILLSCGISMSFHLNPLLSTLFLGVYLGNVSREAEKQLDHLEPIKPLLYICFFTLAGIGLHLTSLRIAGILSLLYFLFRFAGKSIGAMLGGWLARTSRRIWAYIPLGLLPQAGVPIGLVVLLEGNPGHIPRETIVIIAATVLASVTISEIIGPIALSLALKKTGEAGLDRPRLIEFLQEEYILTNLKARDKWDALRQLTEFFCRTHNLPPEEAEHIYPTIEEREKTVTTAIGHGAAIPHGRVESGDAIQGVLGICPDGIDFGAPDGEPVKIIMLIVTPREHEKHHLEVLAALASMVSSERIRKRLIAAVDPNDAWEIIESKEARGFNYFLESPSENPEAESTA